MATDEQFEHLPLNALRAFEVAARYQSISRASEELCVTQAAVSQQVTHLEERLGVPLFTRHHRKVVLTDDGRSLATVLHQSFEQISTAIRKVKRSKSNRVLKVVLFPTLAIRWLLPRLARFHDQHPDVDVQITTSMARVNFITDDVDFSILYGEQIPKEVDSIPIFSEVLLPVCSPRLIQGKTLTLDDLASYTLLHSTNRLTDWPQWLKHAGAQVKSSGGELFLGNSYLAYQAAIDGLGIAMAQLALVEQDLADGRLIAPFSERLSAERTYHLAYLASRKNQSKIVMFRNWVLYEIERDKTAAVQAS